MTSTINEQEIAKFAQHATEWWSTTGPLRTLHAINPLRLDYIAGFVPLRGQRVLDIGCGGGILAEGLAQRGALVTGIDAEPAAIAAAQEHALLSGLSIDYLCQDIVSYTAAPLPIITCLEMLEHVSAPELVIQHAARLLAPGGYLFLSTINRTWRAYAKVVLAAEYLLGLLPKQTHDYERFIKPSHLAAMLRGVGLEVVGLSGLAYNPLTHTVALTRAVDTNYLMVCRRV